MHIEDQTAPIKWEDIQSALSSSSSPSASNFSDGPHDDAEPRSRLASKLLGCLNEKRDSYNGVINSIIYMIDFGDTELLELLETNLRTHIIVEPMRYGGKVFITRCLSRLVNERPKFIADFFAPFLTNPDLWAISNVRKLSEIVRIKIMALRALHQVEQKSGYKVADVTSEVIDAICDKAMLHGDETTKIDTLYILLDTKSATKVLSVRELGVFKLMFRDTLNFQVPALRQKFLAMTSKLIKRIRDSIRVVQRDNQRYLADVQASITSRYMDFVRWLIEICLDNIYCNKYFGSFIITMTTLSYIIEHITLSNPNLPIAEHLMNRRFYDSILSCLALDSFEDNKKMALKLLFSIPKSDGVLHEGNLILFEKIAYELVNSVNPAHSLTCQYIFKLLIGKSDNHSMLVYGHLDKLVNLVEAGLRETRKDFISALKNNAIYPKLTCIRALLNEISIGDLQNDREQWEKLAERLVGACIESSQAVSSIVCNMNPETIGHLPMDLKPIDASMLSVDHDSIARISTGSINTITSQHLLITGWKTIKECSLSLGAMVSVFWWPEAGKESTTKVKPILSDTQIEAIIDFFEHFLRNLRHRGAFEQAYNGFIMVTKRIWLDPRLRRILLDNLNAIMQDFKSLQEELDLKKVDYLKKHVTRRSAGLPFLIQAIAVSEHRNDSETLRSIMDSLIDVSKSSKAEAYQKIHCLNILKALMNDFNLGEKVTPYIGEVLLITINAFGSDNFSIRNCANMLMRALVDRTFGVSRLRDEIHKRNTLSYEKFFSDYPALHKAFQAYLENGLEDRRSFASVHAVFIVLFRLRPSLNPSKEIIEPFIGPVLKLAQSCPDFKLRELAAKLYVQLESHHMDNTGRSSGREFTKLDECMSEFLREAKFSWTCMNFNKFHGNVCILKSWLEVNQDQSSAQSASRYATRFICSGVDEMCALDGDVILCRPFESNTITLWTIALDLVERYSMGQPDDPNLGVAVFFLDVRLKESMPRFDPRSLIWRLFSMSDPFGPIWCFSSMLESIVLKKTSLYIYLGYAKSTEWKIELVEMVRRRPDRLLSVNLQAALVRLIRQLLDEEPDGAFVDKLMENLDLDATAAHMTPIDRLNQHSELDSQKELWLRYSERLRSKMRLISDGGPEDELRRVFDMTKYEEFQLEQVSETKELDLSLINSPRATELLALVLKGWNYYRVQEVCIWSRRGETMVNKLEFLIRMLQLLPDCDLKCLVLLCASKYFLLVGEQIISHTTEKSALTETEQVANRSLSLVMIEFTRILEELADGQHDRMVRETCSEALNTILCKLVLTPVESLKEAHMNLLSTLIKLCQDEAHDIRVASSKVIARLHSCLETNALPDEQVVCPAKGRLDNLIALIATKRCFFDPKAHEDVMYFFELLVRVIFHHTKATLIDVNEERESLFDKTKPNTFADHVTTIHEALLAANEFFKQAGGKVIQIESLNLSPEISLELSSTDMQTRADHTIGDYSWRLMNDLTLKSPTTQTSSSVETNRAKIDGALLAVKRSLSYFDYWNMLTDTSFGYHESSIFKRLAFVKLVSGCSDYKNDQLLREVRDCLGQTIATACATTILCKCHDMLCETLAPESQARANESVIMD